MNQLLKEYSKKTVVPTGRVNGAIYKFSNNPQSEESDDSDMEDEDQSYEQDFVQNEMKKYSLVSDKKPIDEMSNIDHIEGFSGNAWDIYDHYNFNLKLRPEHALPVDLYKQKILGMLNINNVLIVQGPTGCGKTTQIPQFILDDCRHKAEMCNIVVTQPRRIAAINIARRVCAERSWTLGEICGYQVGLEREIKRDVILTYVTTGVLLQRIIQAKSLNQFSHIIIDEVHERNQDLDFLLLIVRRFLYTNSLNTKVILMSATFDTNEFAYYFRSQNLGMEFLAPVVQIEKPCQFKKQVFYLDQIPPWTGDSSLFKIEEPIIHKDIWNFFPFLINILHRFDHVDPMTNERKIGSVLVFLPGLLEIEEAHKRLIELNGQPEPNKIFWEIIPLHSSLPSDEQAKVFKTSQPGCRKIILSTNIAESSITVPDTAYVIDFCLTKVMTVDPISNYCSLKLEWASHVNCEQRAGRVGRVGDGRIYRLVPKVFYEKSMAKRGLPEILRAPLENVVLHAKMLELNDTPKQILALALDPPNLKSIDSTVWRLKEAGGLLMTCRGIKSASDGDLTFLGTVMGKLPLDIHLSKLIVLGHMFSCLDEAIIMAAGCSIQNIFSVPFNERFNAYKKLLLWADTSCSDLIALLNLYNVWQSMKRENNFENVNSEKRWCTTNFVSLKGLREWHILVTEVKERLAQMRITNITGTSRTLYSDKEKAIILKIIICGAFYPNYFIRSDAGGQIDEKEAVRMSGGRDPFKTIYFTGMTTSQPKQLYVRAIKKLLHGQNETNQDVFVGFDGSSKIYVEYRRYNETITVNSDGQQQIATLPNKIPIDVYEGVRKRQLKYDFKLNLLPDKEAWKWSEKFKVKEENTLLVPSVDCYSTTQYDPIPSFDTEYIKIVVTQRIDAGNFWVQHLNTETTNLLANIFNILNKQVLHPVEKNIKRGILYVGALYAARYTEDNKFYRCRLISFDTDNAQILFVDYGNMQSIKIDDLHILPNLPDCHLKPIAMRCTLRGIKPSLNRNLTGGWSADANKVFDELTENVILYGRVYSVVNDIVHLDLYRRQPGNTVEHPDSLNEWLIKKNFAQVCEESYLSKEDHEKRQQVLKAEDPNSEATRWNAEKINNFSDFGAPEIGDNFTTLQLKGPFSPLEMKIYGCTRSSSNKRIDILGNSVNTVLLDSEPQDPHARLLVAATVSEGGNGMRLLLRQTTIMPNIPGFPMLMALIFSPKMEPKITDNGSQVAAILCGLGENNVTKRPFFPSNDMVLSLDTELTVDDIQLVNEIRYLMNNFIRCMSDINGNIGNINDLVTKQRTFKESLFKLLSRPRKSVTRKFTLVDDVWGETNSTGLVLRSPVDSELTDVWPLLWFIQLDNNERHNQIEENLDELLQIARRMIPAKEIKCLVCDEQMSTVSEVVKHLLSKTHKQNEAQFKFKFEN